MIEHVVVPGAIRVRYKSGRLPEPTEYFAFMDRLRKGYPERVSGGENSIPNCWDFLIFVQPSRMQRVIRRLLKDSVIESAEPYAELVRRLVR